MIAPNFEDLMEIKKKLSRFERPSNKKSSSPGQGRQKSLFKGRGLDFSEHREYAPEDDVRSIDWKVTARTDRPHSKLFSEERERSLYLIVDLNASMRFGTRKTFKSVQAARAAAYLAWAAHRANDRIGAVLFGQVEGGVKVLKAKTSREPIWTLFKNLCAGPVTGKGILPLSEAIDLALRRIPRGASVVIVSDFLNRGADFDLSLRTLSRGRDLTLIQVTDPADSRLAQIGEVQFCDANGESRRVNTSSPRGGENYLKLWQEHQSSLTRAARLSRAKLISLSTTDNVADELKSEVR